MQHVDTAIIGGGQAGLSMGYCLAQRGRRFVILDANARVGDAWRQRWDSLKLFTSARHNSLPGMPFPAPDGHFPTKDEMADYLETYALWFGLPVQLNTRVETVTRDDARFLLEAGARRFAAERLVVATGYHRPYLPDLAAELAPGIAQRHSSAYRNPDQVPPGDVLVVGAGNSGAEIAMELRASGRRVWLSGRDTGHIPLRFFNLRLFWWLTGRVLTMETRLGRTIKARKERAGRGDPLVRLKPTDLRRAGVERVPRVAGARNGKPQLEGGRVLDVAAVVWATGFRPDFGWLKLPGLAYGADGYPLHERGLVATEPGLAFLGLPFQRTFVSATVGGVAADARYLAERLADAENARSGAHLPLHDREPGYRPADD